MTSTSTDVAPASSLGLARATSLLAALTVANVAFQFVTAGRLFGQGGSVELHGTGAIVLHVLSGLTAISAIAVATRSRSRTAMGLAALAAVVFVFTFVQAYTGSHASLAVHVPSAFVMTLGAVWVLVASLRTTHL